MSTVSHEEREILRKQGYSVFEIQSIDKRRQVQMDIEAAKATQNIDRLAAVVEDLANAKWGKVREVAHD